MLVICGVPGTLLSSEDKVMNKTEHLFSWDLQTGGETKSEHINPPINRSVHIVLVDKKGRIGQWQSTALRVRERGSRKAPLR